MAKAFRVWNGVSISPEHQSLADIRDAVLALKPAGAWGLEWLPKAGEGGSYQAAYLHPEWGDFHPLAIDGPDKLRQLYREGQRMRPKLTVTPYIALRGGAAWQESEWNQIAACAAVTGRVVLNLEPGGSYWLGQTDPDALTQEYLLPLEARLADVAPRARLHLTAIPRRWCFDELGGAATMTSWLYACYSASWECYGDVAPDLRVDVAIPRAKAMLAEVGVMLPARYYYPLVQRSEIGRWASTPWARYGLECWHLDGDI